MEGITAGQRNLASLAITNFHHDFVWRSSNQRAITFARSPACSNRSHQKSWRPSSRVIGSPPPRARAIPRSPLATPNFFFGPIRCFWQIYCVHFFWRDVLRKNHIHIKQISRDFIVYIFWPKTGRKIIHNTNAKGNFPHDNPAPSPRFRGLPGVWGSSPLRPLSESIHQLIPPRCFPDWGPNDKC